MVTSETEPHEYSPNLMKITGFGPQHQSRHPPCLRGPLREVYVRGGHLHRGRLQHGSRHPQRQPGPAERAGQRVQLVPRGAADRGRGVLQPADGGAAVLPAQPQLPGRCGVA